MDATRPYRLSPDVAFRPEPFGALAYHYGNRRLVFVKSDQLVDLVRSLEEHPSPAAAVSSVAADDHQRRSLTAALSSLADAEVICER